MLPRLEGKAGPRARSARARDAPSSTLPSPTAGSSAQLHQRLSPQLLLRSSGKKVSGEAEEISFGGPARHDVEPSSIGSSSEIGTDPHEKYMRRPNCSHFLHKPHEIQ